MTNQTSLKLLDLFCGAGGCAMGYWKAGFNDITGIDVKPQKNYPFDFRQAFCICEELKEVFMEALRTKDRSTYDPNNPNSPQII